MNIRAVKAAKMAIVMDIGVTLISLIKAGVRRSTLLANFCGRGLVS